VVAAVRDSRKRSTAAVTVEPPVEPVAGSMAGSVGGPGKATTDTGDLLPGRCDT
jgi:hypothetical protein